MFGHWSKDVHLSCRRCQLQRCDHRASPPHQLLQAGLSRLHNGEIAPISQDLHPLLDAGGDAVLPLLQGRPEVLPPLTHLV